MDIHKPKPVHGWREFLNEIGVIVIGVLVALAAEQIVEALHHHEMVSRGEDALRDNFTRFVTFKGGLDQEAPCLAARATELRAIIDEASVRRHLGRVGPIPQPMPMPWQIDTWDAMVASGAAPYLPHYRTVLYSRIAMSAIDVYTNANTEWREWAALRSLSGPPRPFSEAEEAKARDTLARAVGQAELVRFLASHTVERIQSTQLFDKTSLDRALDQGRRGNFSVAMCQPIAVSDH
jgi:hypothetical protein